MISLFVSFVKVVGIRFVNMICGVEMCRGNRTLSVQY